MQEDSKIRKQNGAYKMRGFDLFLFLVLMTRRHTGFGKSYWFASIFETYTLFETDPLSCLWSFFVFFFYETRLRIQPFSSKCFRHWWQYFKDGSKANVWCRGNPDTVLLRHIIYLSPFHFHSSVRLNAPRLRR